MLNIFNTAKVKEVYFKNRIVMAPMIRFGFHYEKGVMGEKLVDEYTSYTNKDIGLIISQVLNVSSKATAWDSASVYAEKHIGYLKKIADKSRENDTRFFGQLGLPGYAFYNESSKDINDLTEQEIEQIIKEFAYAAYLCEKAGLDGVELHGAHTFFLNMFSSQYSNRRKDKYGGDLICRLNLVKEIVLAIKKMTGNNFLVSYRMGWSENIETDIRTAQALENIGIDILHVSTGIPENRPLKAPISFAFNEAVYTATRIKQHVKIPVIAANDIKTIERGEQLITRGYADFAAYGRPFLADSNFIVASLNNADYTPCIGCKRCQWFINGDNCPAKRKRKKGVL